MNTDKFYAEKIANEYAPPKDSKVKALKRLDSNVKNPPRIFALSFGIVFCLVFGTGMTLAMGVLGKGLSNMILGIILGVVGIICMSINYPIYKKFLNNRKNKYSCDIINLAKEITEEE